MSNFAVETARISRQLQEATLCDVCGKPRLVLNMAALDGTRGQRPEPVSPESHCACAPTADRSAGPAYVAPGKTDADFLLDYGFKFPARLPRGSRRSRRTDG